MEEYNWNIMFQHIVREAISFAAQLYFRNSSFIGGPFPYKKAMEFSEILQKSYKGLLNPVPLNPNFNDTDKKLTFISRTISSCFPITPQIVLDLQQVKREDQPVEPLAIQVAPKRFSVSLVETRFS